MKYFGYIYKFTNTLTNKIYIGKREKQTFDESYYGSGREWKKALSKCGKVINTGDIKKKIKSIKRNILEAPKQYNDVINASPHIKKKKKK